MCRPCRDQPESLDVLKQHARINNVLRSSAGQDNSISASAAHRPVRVSVFNPLRVSDHHTPSHANRDLIPTISSPSWMSLLPSQRNQHIRPPRYSILNRRATYPYIECTRWSTPYTTPPEYTGIATESKALSVLSTSAPKVGWQTDVEIPAEDVEVLSNSRGNHPNVTTRGRVDGAPQLRETNGQSEKSIETRSLPHPTAPGDDSSETVDSNRRRHSVNRRYSLRKCPLHSPGVSALSARPPPIDLESVQKRNNTESPVFFKELSSFLASRTGKWVLPSRVGERNLTKQATDRYTTKSTSTASGTSSSHQNLVRHGEQHYDGSQDPDQDKKHRRRLRLKMGFAVEIT